MILHQRCASMLLLCRQSSPPRLFSPLISHFSSSLSLSSSSSSSPSYSKLPWLRPRSRTRSFATSATAAAAEVGDKRGTDTFFAEESISWTSLGVSDRLSQALNNVGLDRPSLVQASCIPCILSGNDVVVAAETGSGKTHGYLVPLMEKLCTIPDNSMNSAVDGEMKLPHRLSLVLCPNVMLCSEQEKKENKLSYSPLFLPQGWPVDTPDIIVSTPVALLNYLRAIDSKKRRHADILRGVKYVVFDEADMLLCGSFQNQVIRLINLFRYDEKLLSRATKSVVEKPEDSCSDSLIASEFQDDMDPQTDLNLPEEEGAEGDTVLEELTEGVDVEGTKGKDWRRVRKIYERSKQYIFVAATLPVNGKKTAGGVLKRMFPEASWVSGHYLHHHNPRLEQKWIEVTVDTQVDVLVDSVKQGFRSKELDSAAGLSRTMVFANTVEAVEAVSKILATSGIECFRYHSDTSLEERTQNLVDFQQKGGILVCTDAAARGLDVTNVSHVIQAEFATSAVDFLHRVGRTARAGQPGLVTSLYSDSNRDLVDAVRQAGTLDLPVEKAFSRKRSFRKKIKKRGRSNVADTLSAGDRVLA
ncbi:hypothetical protein RHMOL_Rhmol12G0145400 [Rhododendron molle]|uniref:Uncharacterized protein n=1 Tax=Rhododendron molle TaxID=49168 RepID=A0ACC0LJ31_RHOML|nr:hypothetical protein RHMOL_Rhmol12G0145400 [Rhododendron molle]